MSYTHLTFGGLLICLDSYAFSSFRNFGDTESKAWLTKAHGLVTARNSLSTYQAITSKSYSPFVQLTDFTELCATIHRLPLVTSFSSSEILVVCVHFQYHITKRIGAREYSN